MDQRDLRHLLRNASDHFALEQLDDFGAPLLCHCLRTGDCAAVLELQYLGQVRETDWPATRRSWRGWAGPPLPLGPGRSFVMPSCCCMFW